MSQAVRAKRLYHKLVPNVLYYEGTTVHRHTVVVWLSISVLSLQCVPIFVL